MILAHLISLDPTLKQTDALARAAGVARFAYNWGLEEWQRQYKSGLRPNAAKIKKAFNEIKKEKFPWIYESPKDANQQAFTDLGQAYQNFFRTRKAGHKGRKVGYPSRRKKGQNDSFYISNDRFHFHADGKRVYLPVIGSVKTNERLRFEGKVLSGRVSRRAGRWYLAVQVEGEFRRPTAPIRLVVGVDLGIKTTLTISRGPAPGPEHVHAPRPLKKNLKALRKANRVLHRRKKGSQNRYKARLKVARIHQRVANIRTDFLQKITTRLCRENQAIVIEDLNVAGMLKNHRLARAISDIGFGTFRRLLTYKAPIFGCEVFVADRWFPSSKRCHGCGNIKEHFDLSERVYSCHVCGLSIGRDENASLNLESVSPRLAGNSLETSLETTPMETRSLLTASAISKSGR